MKRILQLIPVVFALAISFQSQAQVTCASPSILSVSNVTETTADLAWVENNATPATLWDVELIPAAGPPTGVPTYAGVSNNPFGVTGLTPNTCYDFYVRSFCGPAASDTSQWAGPYTFCTNCLPEMPSSTVASCDDLEGWTIGQNGPIANGCGTMLASSGPYWNVNVGGTGSGGTGPLTDHNPGTSTGQYIYLETSTGAGSDTFLTAEYDLSAMNNACLSFYYHMAGAAMGSLEVEVTNDHGASWNNIVSLVGPQQAAQSNPYFESLTNLAAYGGDTIQCRFIGIRGTSFTSDIAVDEICVLECPSCLTPTFVNSTNIGNTTADISWTENNFPASTVWELEVVTSGTSPTGIPTYTGVTSNPFSLTTLATSSCYDVYVRSICGAADTSAWSVAHTFCTPCVPLSVAEFCLAGQFSSGSAPPCWLNTGSAGAWQTSGSPAYSMAGTLDHTNGMAEEYIWFDGSGALVLNEYQTPAIMNADLAAMTQPMISFWLKSWVDPSSYGSVGDNAATDFNEFTLQVSYDNGISFVDLVYINSNLFNAWQEFQAEIDMTALGTNDLIIKLLGNESATTHAAYFNDMAVDDLCIIDQSCIGGTFTSIASTIGSSSCQCTDKGNWVHYGNKNSGELRLSVQRNGVDPNIVPWMVELINDPSSSSFTLGGAPYGTSLWWVKMNRFWNVADDDFSAAPTLNTLASSRQPAAPLSIRHYYSSADYNSLLTAVSVQSLAPILPLTAHTDMYAWKINSGSDPAPQGGHTAIAAADYHQINSGAWTYGSIFAADHFAEYAIPSFSGGGLGFGHENGALPVELLNFTATKSASVTNLDWTTATEENNSHFNILKSTNGTNFEQIGRVNSFAPNGNSSHRLNYSSLDEAPVLGHNYYRLEQVDIDGQKHYSEILDVIWGVTGDLVSIYPNPTNGSLNVDIATEKVSRVEVRLLDMTGRTILVQHATTSTGVNSIKMDLGNIIPGIYNVQVFTNGTFTHSDKVKMN